MNGHVRERGAGNWYAVIETKDPATGKRKRKWHSLPNCTGKRQAQIECSKLVASVADGNHVEPSKLTVAQFLDRWLDHIKPNVSPRTHERYEQIARKNIAPLLGAKPLSKLQPIDISEVYAKLLSTGRRDGKGGLSARSVHHAHRVLYSALGQAERWKVIVRNPAALLEKRDRPKIERKSVRTIDAPATAAVFDAARERRLFVPLVLASLCGLRRGEIAALRWKAVDLDNAQMAVIASTEQTDAGAIREKEAKSGRARTVALPSMAVEELRRWRLQQAQELLRLGVRADDELARGDSAGRVPASAQEPDACGVGLPERVEGHPARTTAQPRQPHVGIEHPSQDRPGAPGALVDRDHDGYLQPPHAEHAGRRRRCG